MPHASCVRQERLSAKETLLFKLEGGGDSGDNDSVARC